MTRNGTFTFTTGNPIQLPGFKEGAAAPWAQGKDVQSQMKTEIEAMFDVFSDGFYSYEDYYKYLETGF